MIAAALFLSRIPEVPRFQQALHDQLWGLGTAKISDHAYGEWDRIVVADNNEPIWSVWKRTGVWSLGYLFLAGYDQNDSRHIWIFIRDGNIVGYASVHQPLDMGACIGVRGDSIPFLPYSMRDLPADAVLEVQTWESSSHPFCRHRAVLLGGSSDDLGVARLETRECPEHLRAKNLKWRRELQEMLDRERREWAESGLK